MHACSMHRYRSRSGKQFSLSLSFSFLFAKEKLLVTPVIFCSDTPVQICMCASKSLRNGNPQFTIILVDDDSFFKECKSRSHFQGKYIATRKRFHTPSHAVTRRIFTDVEERERIEKKRSLFRETITS